MWVDMGYKYYQQRINDFILSELPLLSPIPLLLSQQVRHVFYGRKYQKNLEKQTGPSQQPIAADRGNVNPGSVGV